MTLTLSTRAGLLGTRVQIFAHSGWAKFENRADLISRTLELVPFKRAIYTILVRIYYSALPFCAVIYTNLYE